MKWLRRLFGDSAKETMDLERAEWEQPKRLAIIATYVSVLEAKSQEGRLVGRLSELPYPKEKIADALRAGLLLSLIAEDTDTCKALEASLVALETFLPDADAQLLIEWERLVSEFVKTYSPETHERAVQLRDAVRALNDAMTQRSQRVLGEIETIRQTARSMRKAPP